MEVNKFLIITMKTKNLSLAPRIVFGARNLPNTPTMEQIRRYPGRTYRFDHYKWTISV
jgi:hypothetical protein